MCLLNPQNFYPRFLHVKPGKGSAFVRSKLNNIVSGAVVDKMCRSGETLQLADMERRTGQYTYNDGNNAIMEPNIWIL